MKTCDICDQPVPYRHEFQCGPGIDGGQACCKCSGCDGWCDDTADLEHRETMANDLAMEQMKEER